MKMTGNYRQGIERFIPSPAEAVVLATLLFFTWYLYGGTGNDVFAGLSTFIVVAIAWVLGVAIRVALNDMRWWLLVIALLLVMAPWLALNTFQIAVMTEVLVFSLLLHGLNVVTGLTGQMSLGHGALVGLSAYAVAILVDHWDWPLLPAMAVAVALTFAFGFALGIPALRLAGPYLAIATVAAALVFPLVLKLDSVQDYTGGVQGLRLHKQPQPPGFIGGFLENESIAKIPEQKKFAPEEVQLRERQKFAQSTYLYFLCFGVAAIGTFAAWNLQRSRFGRAFIAVRDAEVAATSMGINGALYKVTAFGISALYAGITGALLYMVVAFVAPESFDLFNLSINPIAYLVIGGLAAPGGAMVGAFGYKWGPEVIKKIARTDTDFDKLQGALTGLMLIVVMTRMPQGVWGSLTRLNSFSWKALINETKAWVLSRTIAYWLAIALGVAVVIAIGAWFAPVWGVFAAGLLVVAPQDAWAGVFLWLRSLPAIGRRRAPAPGDAR